MQFIYPISESEREGESSGVWWERASNGGREVPDRWFESPDPHVT